MDRLVGRVLARILKIPVQNSNSKTSAPPDLATSLLRILIPTTFNSLFCQKGKFTLQSCPRQWFVRKILDHFPKIIKIENSRIFYSKRGFQKTACWMGPGYIPTVAGMTWDYNGRTYFTSTVHQHLDLKPVQDDSWQTY